MEGQVFQYGKKRFQKHMKSKEAYWKPINTFIGQDFAIFEFDFKYQMENAFAGCQYWNTSYNYNASSDGDKRFVIINRSTKEGEDRI
jgi:hypothetical protein